jgi:hypothetical protein
MNRGLYQKYLAGILYGVDGANIAQCEEILHEIAFARTLDDGANELFLQAFEQKVKSTSRGGSVQSDREEPDAWRR